jgi:hypothetical protein
VGADDNMTEDLRVDADDLDMDLVPHIAERAGRSLNDTRRNPLYGKVRTVRDLVAFLEAQPKWKSLASRRG